MKHLSAEVRSKIQDGLIAAILPVLMLLVCGLLSTLLGGLFGRIGWLMFSLGMLALSIYFLEHSMLNRVDEPRRLFFAIVGGTLAWVVTEMGILLGSFGLTGEAGLVLWLLMALVVGVLWRRGLPLGARFYAVTYLLHWLLRLVAASFRTLMQWVGYATFGRILLALAIGAGLYVLYWLFRRSRTRVQRLQLSMALWVCITAVLYILGFRFF